MKQMVKIIRKVDMEKKYRDTLLVEQDYLLGTLFEAMKNKDQVEIAKCKARLREIHRELELYKG